MISLISSRLSVIAVLLTVSIAVAGCGNNAEECVHIWTEAFIYVLGPVGIFVCAFWCSSIFPPSESYNDCTQTPENCDATLEHYQAAIEFCEEHPAECQQVIDAWVESFEEEAIQ